MEEQKYKSIDFIDSDFHGIHSDTYKMNAYRMQTKFITLITELLYIVLFSLTATTYRILTRITSQQLYIELIYLSNLSTETNLINVISLTFPPYYINLIKVKAFNNIIPLEWKL